MSIKLNGATNGSLQLTPEASLGSDRVITLNATGNSTLTLPDANGTLDRLERTGNILQVVEGSTSTAVTISSTTYTNTGLSATITPTKASSKILILTDQFLLISRQSSNHFAGIRLERGNVTIMDPVTDSTGPFNIGLHITGASVVQNWFQWSNTFLDSPNTTNSVTYKTQARMYQNDANGTMTFQQGAGSSDGSSRMILMEVAV